MNGVIRLFCNERMLSLPMTHLLQSCEGTSLTEVSDKL